MSDRREKRETTGLPTSKPAHDFSNNLIPLAMVQETWVKFAQEIRLHPFHIEGFKRRLNEIKV